MKRIKYLLFMALFLLPISAKADNIYNIDINANIKQDGTAHITEKWTVKADSGSEWYKQMLNLGNSRIENYTVSMDGKSLKRQESWNVDGSLSDKKGYYGINEISGGIELCFGKYDLNKKHVFTLNYDVTNYVFNTDDAQVVYATLISKGKTDKINVTISSYYSFPDTLDVWGYGYKGYAYVKDGKITMTSEQGLEDEYMVALIKFPLNTFNTTNKVDDFNTFDDVKMDADIGSYKHDYTDYGYKDDNEDFIGIIIQIIAYFIIFGITCIPAVIAVNKNSYGYKDNKEINKKNTPMFRDIPCNKDLHYANALVKLNDFGYKDTNIFGAIILKWVKENKIQFIKDQTGTFNKETGKIDLTKDVTIENPKEKELFDLMRAASGDGILEPKELEKWCKKHYSKFLNLFEKLNKEEIELLKMQNHIYKRTNKQECKKKNVMDDTIYEDSKKLFGLKLFLEEFSKMDTKEVLEVHIWDEYLMFAYLFGVADKVAKQLKNLYPEVLEDPNNNYVDYNTIIFINHISSSGVSAATSARAAAQSYSSGGGGFSSGGGGGGSFGGGGGGSFGGR